MNQKKLIKDLGYITQGIKNTEEDIKIYFFHNPEARFLFERRRGLLKTFRELQGKLNSLKNSTGSDACAK